MTETNRQLKLHSRPRGLLAPGDLELSESAVPSIGPGQALARVRYLSIDPTMRIWMSDRPGYMPPIAIGDVMRAGGIAEIVSSNHPEFKPGDQVFGLTGMQDYVVIGAREPLPYRKIPPLSGIPVTAFLGVLGITGITAYFGLLDVGKPKDGETVVVSAAAGATGSVVGQIAKLHGCHVVGIAGGDEKCAWLTKDLGFDAAINYKAPHWKEKLVAACPQGIDVDFENVGGEVMQTVLGHMNLHGRVVVCGLISGYTTEDPAMASFANILIKRLRVQGFIIFDYSPRYTEAVTQLAQWIMQGKLKDRQTVVEGLEKAPDAINMLFAGGNTGKLMVKV